MPQAHRVDEGVIITIPAEIANRFHLDEGVEVEIEPTEEGIFLRPVGVGHWFSIEWERSLNAVMEYYGEALKQMDEPAPEAPAAEA